MSEEVIRTCGHCASLFVVSSDMLERERSGGSEKTYCDKKCKQGAKVARRRTSERPTATLLCCDECGRMFIHGVRGRPPRFCGRRCRDAFNYRLRAERTRAQQTCIECDAQRLDGRIRCAGCQRDHAIGRRRKKSSRWISIKSGRPQGRGWERFRQWTFENFPYCWRCGEPVDLTLDFPHPRSAVLGHIIGIGSGGDPLDPDNCRTEHNQCNSDAGRNEQKLRAGALRGALWLRGAGL